LTELSFQGLLGRLKSRMEGLFVEAPKRKKPKVKAEKTSTIVAYSHYAFKLLGGRAQVVTKYFEDLRPKLLKAGIRITLRGYVSLMMLVTTIALLVPFAVSLFLGLLFKAAFSGVLLLGCALGLFGWALSFTVFYTYPSIKAGSRSRQIEEELPYMISHMAVLATAGVPPERIFKSVAMTERTSVAAEMTNIVRDVDLLGRDVISALETAGDRSPSKVFSEVSEGLIATVVSGGDVRRYLYDKAKSLMELKMIKAKELSDTLSIVGESYVALLIVFPLVVMIMFTVMACVSSTLAGFNIIMLMYLLAYILVPLMSLAVIILLDGLMPSG